MLWYIISCGCGENWRQGKNQQGLNKKGWDAACHVIQPDKKGAFLNGSLALCSFNSLVRLLAVVQLPGIEEKESRGPTTWQRAQPDSGSVCGGGSEGAGTSLLHPPSPFSSSPQSISNAFLQSSNKQGNSISSTVRPCEISFASLGLGVRRVVKTSLPPSCFVYCFV